ncbi:MAG TPA: hypothetical protein VGG89_14050 [Candidatus Baltobacteraceae bacterium]
MNAFVLAALAVAQTFSLSGTAARGFAVWVSGPADRAAAGEFVMRNVGLAFKPEMIVVPAGSRVRFSNEDPLYHSIYSTDEANGFDLGYYDTGPGKTVTFTRPGVVPLRCHIHASMHGTIVVAGGPYALVRDGRFEIDGLPPEKYTIHFITADGVDHTRGLTLDRNRTMNL